VDLQVLVVNRERVASPKAAWCTRPMAAKVAVRARMASLGLPVRRVL
jgi:hypothetical protein